MWKAIPEYEGLYEASDDGRIRSIDRINPYGRKLRGRVLRTTISSNGYLGVTLCKDGVPHQHSVHRLIALTYIEKPQDCDFINHKDEVKTNNAVENLEWCTKQYNNTYNGKMEKQLRYTKKPILQKSLQGEIVAVFDCTAAAVKKYGFDKTGISACCRGRSKTYKGYQWAFAQEVK